MLLKLYMFTSETHHALSLFHELFTELNFFEDFILAEAIHLGEVKAPNNFFQSNNRIVLLAKYKCTSFALLTCEVILLERILYLLTSIQHKYRQTKNEIFIYLNILDLGPLYTVSIKKRIINKLSVYLKYLQYKYLSLPTDGALHHHIEFSLKSDYNLISITNMLNENTDYMDIQCCLYKLFSLRNLTSRTAKKKILFVFDLDNNFLKDSIFKEILYNHFIKSKRLNDFQFYFSYFDNKLHILSNMNFDDIDFTFEENKLFAKGYLKNIPLDEYKNSLLLLNQTFDSNRQILSEGDYFFDYLSKVYINKEQNSNNSNSSNNSKYRADKALYHSAVFGIPGEYLQSSFSLHFRMHKYLVMFVSINSEFSNNEKNWEEISRIVYEHKFTLIIILCVNYDIDNNNETFQKKLNNYKQCINNYIIDGYLFIMKNFTMMKVILNSIFPIRFSEFNTNIIYHFFESLQLINKHN